MKLVSLFTASALLAATEATIAEATCTAPIMFGGEEFCFKYNKKGIKKSTCSNKTKSLMLTKENKLCDGEADADPYCLVAKGNKFKFASKGEAVLFNYDSKVNSLKGTSPKTVKDKYLQFDKKAKKVKKWDTKQHKKFGISCNVPSGYFKCYHRKNVSFTQEGRVLRPSIKNSLKKDEENFSGFLIHERVTWYSIKLERFGWWSNIGWGPPTPSLYNKRYTPLGNFQHRTIAVFQTKEYDYSYNAYLYNYLNLGQTEYSYRKTSVKIEDGDLIKVEYRLSGTVWQLNGRTFITHNWYTGDERDLRPAFDIYYDIEKYVVTLGATVEAFPSV